MGTLEDAIGVDQLEVGVGTDGSVQVGTGKYVTDDVYVELRSNTRGAPGVDIEWTPRNNVEVSAEIESEEPPKLKIQWKRDYD